MTAERYLTSTSDEGVNENVEDLWLAWHMLGMVLGSGTDEVAMRRGLDLQIRRAKNCPADALRDAHAKVEKGTWRELIAEDQLAVWRGTRWWC